jgi:hypothetical protein
MGFMTNRVLTRLALSLLLCTVPLTRAHADVAVMVPPQSEQEVGVEVVEQGVEELMRLLKLRGFDVISAGQSAPAAEAEQERGAFSEAYDPLHCLTPECANEYRKLFDATFAVQLSLATRALRVASVSVILTEAAKVSFKGSAAVEGRDVRSAVRAAFESARQKQEEGAGPWLTVQGTPAGATVYLDGVEYGRVPFAKRHIEAGPHVLEARAEQHATEQRSLQVPSKIDHVELVSLALAPVGSQLVSERSDKRDVHRSAWDWALGGAITAAGAVHLGAGIHQKVRAGDCVERVEGRCTVLYGDDRGVSRENLLIGLGSAGIGLGALVLGLGPIGRLQMRSSVNHALLQLNGEF